MDDIIITKLYNKYRAFNYAQLAYSKQIATTPTAVFHRSTGQTVYKAAVNTAKGRVYLGLFPTLTEALEVKVKYMQEHNLVKGIANLSNKLKELTCQQN